MRSRGLRSKISLTGIALVLAAAALPISASADQSETWTPLTNNSSGDQFISSLSCYNSSDCTATSGYDSSVYITTDQGKSWTIDHTQKAVGRQGTVVCLSNGTCYELGALQNASHKYVGVTIAKSRNGGAKWDVVYTSNVPPETGLQPTYSLDSISCPTTSVCIVAGNDGKAGFTLITRNAGETWKKVSTGALAMESVSCATTLICYGASGSFGVGAYKSTKSGASWVVMPIPPNMIRYPGDNPIAKFAFYTITCASVNYCVAGGQSTVTSGYTSAHTFPLVIQTVNGSSWLYGGIDTTPDSVPRFQAYIDDISCPKKDYCFAGTSYGAIVDITYLNNKLEVSGDYDTVNAPYILLTDTDCPTMTFCIAAAQNAKTYIPELGRIPISPVLL
jgi:hypothetical protein